MVVVSLFTKKIPREELGGLTWSTINEPPISHGAIGEEAENESVENEDIRVAYNVRKTDSVELLDKGKTPGIVSITFRKNVVWIDIKW